MRIREEIQIKEIERFLEKQIKGIEEAIKRHDSGEVDTKHWVSTKEQLIERMEYFKFIKGYVIEQEKEIKQLRRYI